MKQISDRYKNDEVTEVPENIKVVLDREFWHTRPNLLLSNPKVLVIFSGTNGVGKTTISRKIERELNGLVIENDAIKKVLQNHFPALSHRERGLITWNYTMSLYHKITDLTTNGLVVRDGVIDWYFDRIIPIFINQGFSVFTIAFSVSEAMNTKLILQRGDTDTVTTDLLINQISEHSVHIKRFRDTYSPDITLSDQNLFEHDLAIGELRKKISSLS